MALSKIPLSLTSGLVQSNQINDPITLSDAITIDNPGSETRITGKAATPISLNYNYNGYQKVADVAYETSLGPYLTVPENSGLRKGSRYWNFNSDNVNTYANNHASGTSSVNESPWIIIGAFQFRSGQYLHVKLDRVSNSSGPMEQVWAQGYLYNQGVFDAHVGWYSYTGGPINIHVRNNCTSGGITIYQSSDNKIVVRCDRGTTGYTEGEVTLCWRTHGMRNESPNSSYFPQMLESRTSTSSSVF